MLLAVLAASLPWIIEWLFRRRKRQVDLPTLRFLLRNKEQENIKRQDRILLIVRTILLILLALALARPQMRRGMMGGGKRRHLVIALDATASMHQQVGVTTAFGVAQRRAAGLIRGVEGDALITVLQLGARADGVIEMETDTHTAAAQVDSMRATLGAAPATDALRWIKDYFDRTREEEAEIYFFSDFQQYTWARPGGLAAETTQHLRDLAAKNDIYMVDVGSQHEFNYIVTDLRPTEQVLSTGLPVTFQARVETWGTPPADANPSISLVVNGKQQAVRYFTPGENAAVVNFDYQFSQVGENLVEVVVDGDQHLIDNQRAYLCTVPDYFPILIIDETAAFTIAVPGMPDDAAQETEDPLGMESVYLARAIAPPTHPAMEKITRFSAKAVHPSALRFENLDNYPVVIVTQLASLDERTATRLEQFATDGGALWFFLGPDINAYDYNRFFHKDGAGPLPAKILDRRILARTADRDDERPFVSFGGSTHPALYALAASEARDARFLGTYNLETPAASRVALALSDQTPFLIEKEHGRGRVMLANTTASVNWTYLPAVIEYPILIQDMLRYLVGNPDRDVNLDVGDVFEQTVYVSAQHLIVQLPNGQRTRLTPQSREGDTEAWFVRFDQTDQQGVYSFVDTMPGVVPRTRFIVNQRSEEGDLSRMSEAEFRSAFGRGHHTWVSPDIPVEDLAAKLHSITEFAQWILWILLIVLGAEAYLAMRYGRRRARRTRTA